MDLQVNGHRDVDVATADESSWRRLLAEVAGQGVTSWCPTLISAPLPVLDARLAAIGDRAGQPGPNVISVHLEGPYLGAAHGAHQAVAADRIDMEWIAGLPAHVGIVTLGPEREGALDAIRLLRERGIVVALGHTQATAEQTEAAIEAGATMFTHLYNAAGPLHHREPGALGVALTDDRLVGGLIADGVHVDVRMMRLAWRAKGSDRIALVTDAAAFDDAALVDWAPRLADGTLAGSALRMNEAVRRTVDEVGISLIDAVNAASAVPASVLGLDDRGSITPGCRADLVAMSDDFQVQQTWVAGLPQLAGVNGS